MSMLPWVILVLLLGILVLVLVRSRPRSGTNSVLASTDQTLVQQKRLADTPHSWNTKEIRELEYYITQYLESISVPSDRAMLVAKCIVTGFMRNLYNYHRAYELITRDIHGGEMSKDTWDIVSSCIQVAYRSTSHYVGKRNMDDLLHTLV